MKRGDPVLYRGERYLVKDVISPTWPIIEDDDGFAFAVDPAELTPIGYTAVVDSDGWVRSIEDSVENREGDPAFNGALDRW